MLTGGDNCAVGGGCISCKPLTSCTSCTRVRPETRGPASPRCCCSERPVEGWGKSQSCVTLAKQAQTRSTPRWMTMSRDACQSVSQSVHQSILGSAARGRPHAMVAREPSKCQRHARDNWACGMRVWEWRGRSSMSRSRPCPAPAHEMHQTPDRPP